MTLTEEIRPCRVHPVHDGVRSSKEAFSSCLPVYVSTCHGCCAKGLLAYSPRYPSGPPYHSRRRHPSRSLGDAVTVTSCIKVGLSDLGIVLVHSTLHDLQPSTLDARRRQHQHAHTHLAHRQENQQYATSCACHSFNACC